MLQNFLAQEVVKMLGFKPTSDQSKGIQILSHFASGTNESRVLIINGYAGTGKTSLIAAFTKVMKKYNRKMVLLAPTGRAAKVLTSFSGETAYTIHKHIYRQKESTNEFSGFGISFNKHHDTVFIIDEASMISNQSSEELSFGTGRLLDDLLAYIFSGERCSVIFIGDKAQLPPVGTISSPALDANEFSGYGIPTEKIVLKEVVRQALSSGIFYNATNLRHCLRDAVTEVFPKITTEGFDDIVALSGADLVDSVAKSYSVVGSEETIIITRSNKRANEYNKGIRNTVLFREDELGMGDWLMVVKNNYFWANEYKNIEFIANGDIACIERIRKHQTLYGMNFVDVSLRFPDMDNEILDARIIKETLSVEGPSLPYPQIKALYSLILEDYSDLKSKKKISQAMRVDPYFNALQTKFAYAITCHKAQGGQWKHVYIDLGYLTQEMVNIEFLRWLYTALTRATEKVFLVNFPRGFYDD